MPDMPSDRETCLAALQDLRRVTSELDRIERTDEWRKVLTDLEEALLSGRHALEQMESFARAAHAHRAPQDQLSRELEEYHRVFLQLLPTLRRNPRYDGCYVAIVGGEVADSDADEIALAERAAAAYPDAPVFIGCVKDNTPEVIFSSPEFSA